jgi:hypothetical protein
VRRLGVDDRRPLPGRPDRHGVQGDALRVARLTDGSEPVELGIGALAVPRLDVAEHDRDGAPGVGVLSGRADGSGRDALALVRLVALVVLLSSGGALAASD